MSAADAKLPVDLFVISSPPDTDLSRIRCRGRRGKEKRDANIVYTVDDTANRNICTCTT